MSGMPKKDNNITNQYSSPLTPFKPINNSAMDSLGSTAPVTSNSPIANSKLPGNRPLFPPPHVVEEYRKKTPEPAYGRWPTMGSDGATYRDPWANSNQIPSAGNNRRTK